jgi:hypothetical protein
MGWQEDRLKARVRAVNAANLYAAELYKKLVAVFEPFVGQKILKADGTLLAKIEPLVKALNLPNTPKLSVYRHSSDYSLAWTVKTSEWTQEYTVYHEVVVYIGDLGLQTLKGITPPYDHAFNYTAEDVAAKRKAYEAAKKVMEDARSELYPFGEYDR